MQTKCRQNRARGAGPGHPSAQRRGAPVVEAASAVRSVGVVWIDGDPIAKRDLGVRLCGGAAGAGTWGRVTSGTFRGSGAPGANAGLVVNGAVDGDGTRSIPRQGRGDTINQERQRSVESVGAGAGSSAHSWPVLRGGVIHRWCLRIPCTHLQPAPHRWQAEPFSSTPLLMFGNGPS